MAEDSNRFLAMTGNSTFIAIKMAAGLRKEGGDGVAVGMLSSALSCASIAVNVEWGWERQRLAGEVVVLVTSNMEEAKSNSRLKFGNVVVNFIKHVPFGADSRRGIEVVSCKAFKGCGVQGWVLGGPIAKLSAESIVVKMKCPSMGKLG